MNDLEAASLVRPSVSGRRVLIVGGSTRAAAWSAVRAGWTPVCADLFADLDTRQVAEIIHVRDFPASLPEDVADVKADGWFYTGGLENHPDIIDRMLRPDAPYGPLWGSPPAALRLVRDPFWLAETLRAAGLPTLDVRPESSPPPADGTWLQKPLASAGGRAIRVWDRDAASRDFGEPHSFQTYLRPGRSCAAIFRAGDGSVEWQGATTAWIGQESSRPPHPFSYCGSEGPTAIPEQSQRMLQQMAEILVRASGVVGLFGIDFQWDGGTPWLVELNPRYTASVEVLELMRRRPLLRVPGDVRSSASTPDSGNLSSASLAKVVLYASQPFVAPDFSRLLRDPDPWRVPYVADVPVEGTVIEAGWPICSVFGGDDRHSRVHRRECEGLFHRINTVWKRYVDPAAELFRFNSAGMRV